MCLTWGHSEISCNPRPSGTLVNLPAPWCYITGPVNYNSTSPKGKCGGPANWQIPKVLESLLWRQGSGYILYVHTHYQCRGTMHVPMATSIHIRMTMILIQAFPPILHTATQLGVRLKVSLAFWDHDMMVRTLFKKLIPRHSATNHLYFMDLLYHTIQIILYRMPQAL
jgi:hypothetical protein